MILASQGAYDPDAPEGSKPRGSEYISVKDVRWIIGILAVLGVLFWPVYDHMRRDGEKTVCKRNLESISKAMLGYAEFYDGRFPPLYVEGDNQTPYLEKGRPVVWASTVSSYMSSYGTFTCPSAQKEEATSIRIQAANGSADAHLDYGMYRPMSTKAPQELAKPEGTVLVAETSNMGAHKTYSPIDYQNSKEEVVPFNGFMIGWNNSNFDWDKDSNLVTHLAFYDTANGDFQEGKSGRHDKTIFCIFANGRLGKLAATDAVVVNDAGNRLEGYWANR